MVNSTAKESKCNIYIPRFIIIIHIYFFSKVSCLRGKVSVCLPSIVLRFILNVILHQRLNLDTTNHSFSSRLNYIITVTVPLLTGVCTIQEAGWIICHHIMQIENNYKCCSVV